MEQFTRECLEIDNESSNGKRSLLGVSTTMDKIYERAAKLVKRTLDVEGAIVLDVSHSEVLETSGAEGTVSVIIHGADAESGMRNQSLTAEDFAKLNEFFAKYPDGRISETVVPPCLRAFLPHHIQYALSK
jgi:pimeloyl-CoA synthetase